MHPIIQLSSEELATLGRGEALHLRANNARHVVVVLAEQYELLKKCVDFADADPKSVYPLLADVLPQNWDDLSAYPHAEQLR